METGIKKQEQGGRSNKDDCTDHGQPTDNAKKWVRNLSSIPLTKEQENLLSHGPNFAISPKKPLLGDYIVNIEKVCQSLDTNMAEELRSEVYRVFKKPHQSKSNLKKEKRVTLKQLKSDNSHMVLTADKGVALVVIDTADYIQKAKEILEDTNTYRVIHTDPTSRLKNKSINILRRIRQQQGYKITSTRKCTLLGSVLQNSMGYPKFTRKHPPKAHSIQHWICCIWGGKSIGWYHQTINGLLTTPCSRLPAVCRGDERNQVRKGGMHYLIWCNCIIYLNSYTICLRGHEEEAGTRHRAAEENHHASWQHLRTSGLLFK